MIDRFEDLTEDDFHYWELCCQLPPPSSPQGGLPDALTSSKRGILKAQASSNHLEESKRSSVMSQVMEEALASGSVPRYGLYKTELALLSKSN